ncbi:MAG: hypothetical protein WDN04_13505 [Rhodospirillales bacterium]
MRAAMLDGFAWLFARPILRLAIGAWPAPADVDVFRGAFRRFTPLPPLLRGLAMLPAGRNQLTRAMLASWLLARRNLSRPASRGVAARRAPFNRGQLTADLDRPESDVPASGEDRRHGR